MKLIIANSKHRSILICDYFLLPVVGYGLLGLWGIGIGLLISYVCDRFYPRYAVGLMRGDLEVGLRNFREKGVLASRMCFRFPSRKLFVHRGFMFNETVLGLQFCRKEWDDIITRKEEDILLKKWGAVIMPEQYWRGKSYAYLILDSAKMHPEKAALDLLMYLFGKLGASTEEIPVRVDVAKVDIWEMFGKSKNLEGDRTSP